MLQFDKRNSWPKWPIHCALLGSSTHKQMDNAHIPFYDWRDRIEFLPSLSPSALWGIPETTTWNTKESVASIVSWEARKTADELWDDQAPWRILTKWIPWMQQEPAFQLWNLWTFNGPRRIGPGCSCCSKFKKTMHTVQSGKGPKGQCNMLRVPGANMQWSWEGNLFSPLIPSNLLSFNNVILQLFYIFYRFLPWGQYDPFPLVT